MKISASIVVYNEKEEVLERVIQCFLSLKFKKELIVVDNSEVDRLRPFCESFDSTSYIYSEENIGFGAGHNLAFNNLSESSDIHMIINPDTYFYSKDIEHLLLWFKEQSDTSLATPLVCNEDGSIQNTVRKIPTPMGLLKRKLNIDSGEINIKPNTVVEIPFAHGCFMVFKTDVFEKLGGFDEKFFMYMEDVDIYLRAKKYGKTVINTNYEVFHEYRKGSSKSLKLLFWHLCSAAKFFLTKYSTKS